VQAGVWLRASEAAISAAQCAYVARKDNVFIYYHFPHVFNELNTAGITPSTFLNNRWLYRRIE